MKARVAESPAYMSRDELRRSSKYNKYVLVTRRNIDGFKLVEEFSESEDGKSFYTAVKGGKMDNGVIAVLDKQTDIVVAFVVNDADVVRVLVQFKWEARANTTLIWATEHNKKPIVPVYLTQVLGYEAYGDIVERIGYEKNGVPDRLILKNIYRGIETIVYLESEEEPIAEQHHYVIGWKDSPEMLKDKVLSKDSILSNAVIDFDAKLATLSVSHKEDKAVIHLDTFRVDVEFAPNKSSMYSRIRMWVTQQLNAGLLVEV